MTAKIISAFPGTGKSHFVSLASSDRVIDLDSNTFTDGYTPGGKVRNPDFPDNYIRKINSYFNHDVTLLVSSQKEVLSYFNDHKIPFTLIYPQSDLKEEYIERFRNRKSSEMFISLIANNWDGFINQLESTGGCLHIVLGKSEYISDYLRV